MPCLIYVSDRDGFLGGGGHARQILIMSFPSPTACDKASLPFLNAAFFSSMILWECSRMVSEILMMRRKSSLGTSLRSLRREASEKTNESCSIMNPNFWMGLNAGLHDRIHVK